MELEELARKVAIALMDKNYTIATAEECTCGLLGAAIGSQDYAQRWYKGGITAFTFESAISVIDVPQYTIMRNDFVSSQVASVMALNTLTKFKTNICTSIVGYVDGYGSSDVAAGEVQICVVKQSHGATNFKYKKVKLTSKNRAKNIEICLEEALRSTLEHILED